MNKTVSRRRFISITAIAGLASTIPLSLLADIDERQFYHWRGFAMGADASIKLYNNYKQSAEALTKLCLKEIVRLESLFSLYEPDSVINELNNSGIIKNPPAEFVELLSKAKSYSDLTEGAFDITVQPLWDNGRRQLVDYNKLLINDDLITFKQSGMAITLNGIAQGYITDRVAELLKKNGIDNVLVNMGEIRALGSHDNGEPWQIGILHSDEIETLNDMAIATSGNNGTADNHLFNPKTGLVSRQYKSLSVIAPTATAADALSTALYVIPYKQVSLIIKRFKKTKAVLIMNNNRIVRVS